MSVAFPRVADHLGLGTPEAEQPRRSGSEPNLPTRPLTPPAPGRSLPGLIVVAGSLAARVCETGGTFRWLVRACFPMLCWLAIGCRPPQQYGAIGDLPLQGGEVIRDCRIGYRTFGQLDARRSNAVLVLPWSMGTSGDLARQIGPGKLVDSSRYFVIAVDALANGVSSSPSNSVLQEGEAFPVFTLRDMVESQHRLVFTLLGLPRLHAVVGISLGGMQAFHWATAYPESVRKVVAIAGSPRSSPADRQRWQSWTGDVTGPAWERAAKRLVALEPRSAWGQLRLDAVDYARQAQAIISNDVSAGFEGSLERAARAVRGQLLVAVSPTDDVVEPAAARELARLAGAELIELDGRCRHGAPSCEKATLWPAISRFLEK